MSPQNTSYSCVYCQVGQTQRRQVQRQIFYNPRHIFRQVHQKWKKVKSLKKSIDYLTFAPNGEPTLDMALGEEIALLKPLKTKVAIVTNSSLLHHEEVRPELVKANLISLKVDAMSASVWQAMNRPHPALQFENVVDGIHARDVAKYLGYGVVEIRAQPDAPGIIAEAATLLSRAGISIRQILAEDAEIYPDPKLIMITDHPIPGDLINQFLHIPTVQQVTII